MLVVKAAAAALCSIAFAHLPLSPAQAQPDTLLGWGGIFVNDEFGDGRDRWRTNAQQVSVAFSGPRPGSVLELRFASEMIAGERLGRPDPDDRPYAGLLSAGAHVSFRAGAADLSLGVDFVAIGPQTRVDELQSLVHTVTGGDDPPPARDQVANGIYPTAVVEVARELPLAQGGARLRPFLEAQAGYENFLRAGAELTLGRGGGGLLVRERVSGLRYAVSGGGRQSGLTLVLGADIARVGRSVLLPASDGLRPTRFRSRARAALIFERGPAQINFGLARLGPEFEGQMGGQTVGAFSAQLKF